MSAAIGRGEVLRKLLHLGVGLAALLVPWLTWWQGAAACLAGFLMNWLILPRLTRRALEREEERRRGYAAGILAYPASVGALFVLFGSNPPVVAAAWGILAFGDGAATLVGRALGGPALPWNRGKTVGGFAAFTAAGGAAAALLSGWAHAFGPEGVTHPPSAALCFAAALWGALVESLPTGVNDNVSVPLMTGGLLFAMGFVDGDLVAARAVPLPGDLLRALGVNAAVAGTAWALRLVNRSGALAGAGIGAAVLAFGGWEAFAILLLFFALASGATKVGYARMLAPRIAQEEGGRRGARHAVANCAVPAFAAFLGWATPHADLMALALVGALATAVFDTVSSEIGQVYGRRCWLITTLESVPPGTDGAVSLEGTLAGLGAAAGLAGCALALGMLGALGWAGAGAAVAAALAGTTLESYLGAWLALDNEAMNFANTLAGASGALGLGVLVIS